VPQLIDGAELVAEYRSERAANPEVVEAMVQAGAIADAASRRALKRFIAWNGLELTWGSR
jgi:hypothetical protein